MKQGWEYKKLGEVATFINGYAFKPDQWKEYGTPIVRIQNLNNPNAPYNYFDGEVPDKVKIGDGDLLISWSASLGAYIWNGGNAFLNQHIFKVAFDKTDVDKIYLKYAVTSKLETMAGKVHGATMKHIVKKDFDNTLIPYPPKSTQLSIVSELDKINELIRLKKEQLKDYDNLAQSIFYEMFGDPVENEKGWEVKKLGEVCTVGTGSTPNRKNKDYYEHGEYPWVKSTEVCNLPIFTVEEFITEEAIQNTNCNLYPKDSILMAMYGQGRTRGQVGLLKIEACTNQAIAAIVPSKEMDSVFLYKHLMLMYEHIRDMARGGNQANLNLTIVKSIQIIIPPLPLQHLFAQRIEQIERQKSAVQKSITDLETLLASRMQYWFE